MENKQIKESPLFWPAYLKDNVLHILDETLIPKQIYYIPVKNAAEAVDVIKSMKTRARSLSALSPSNSCDAKSGSS